MAQTGADPIDQGVPPIEYKPNIERNKKGKWTNKTKKHKHVPIPCESTDLEGSGCRFPQHGGQKSGPNRHRRKQICAYTLPLLL